LSPACGPLLAGLLGDQRQDELVSVRTSLLRTTAVRKPRTECGCQPCTPKHETGCFFGSKDGHARKKTAGLAAGEGRAKRFGLHHEQTGLAAGAHSLR
jgi:hypothetical protein